MRHNMLIFVIYEQSYFMLKKEEPLIFNLTQCGWEKNDTARVKFTHDPVGLMLRLPITGNSWLSNKLTGHGHVYTIGRKQQP